MDKKEILRRARLARSENDKELAGILEDYARLKYSYIPQLLSKFDPPSGGKFFPHMSKLNESSDVATQYQIAKQQLYDHVGFDPSRIEFQIVPMLD
jgi:hypothetical protein